MIGISKIYNYVSFYRNHYDFVTSIRQTAAVISSLPAAVQSYFSDQLKKKKESERQKYASTPELKHKKKDYAKKKNDMKKTKNKL